MFTLQLPRQFGLLNPFLPCKEATVHSNSPPPRGSNLAERSGGESKWETPCRAFPLSVPAKRLFETCGDASAARRRSDAGTRYSARDPAVQVTSFTANPDSSHPQGKAAIPAQARGLNPEVGSRTGRALGKVGTECANCLSRFLTLCGGHICLTLVMTEDGLVSFYKNIFSPTFF